MPDDIVEQIRHLYNDLEELKNEGVKKYSRLADEEKLVILSLSNHIDKLQEAIKEYDELRARKKSDVAQITGGGW